MLRKFEMTQAKHLHDRWSILEIWHVQLATGKVQVCMGYISYTFRTCMYSIYAWNTGGSYNVMHMSFIVNTTGSVKFFLVNKVGLITW